MSTFNLKAAAIALAVPALAFAVPASAAATTQTSAQHRKLNLRASYTMR